MESGELLKAENERLLAEMTSMKKKIKLALKKQQAELQARIQAADQRAIAAEAALAQSFVNDRPVATAAPVSVDSKPNSQQIGSPASGASRSVHILSSPYHTLARERLSHSPGSNGQIALPLSLQADRDSTHSQVALKGLQEVEAELLWMSQEEGTGDGRSLENEITELRNVKDKGRLELEEDLRHVTEDAERSVEHLTKANEKLGGQMMGTTEDIAGAFPCSSTTHGHLNCLSKECHEAKAAHSNLATDFERLSRELEQARADLSRAELLLQNKPEEMEEMAAASEALQSGQQAAMPPIMHQLEESQSFFAQPGEIRSKDAEASNLCEEIEELHVSHHQAVSRSMEEILSLKEALQESRTAQEVCVNQVKHFSVACTEAHQRIETLSKELADAHKNLDYEVTVREDKYAELEAKYAELEAKFGRLQKRAKQRIQEVQKEKEEVEAYLSAATEKTAHALSKQSALQCELDHARLQAGEAFRALDVERQQLRVANSKLKDEAEELRRSVQGKENNLVVSRRLASENDQKVLEMTSMLKEVEVKQEAVVSEMKEKHRRIEENLNAQLVDATLENRKMVETISTLQRQLEEKETKLAELDAASSGEVVRLGASLEAAKGEVSRLELEHKKDIEVWQSNSDKLKRRVEQLEKAIHQQELAAGEMRSKLESELECQRQVLCIAQADLSAAKVETTRLSNDLAAYKVRAYALLQKKESELLAAKDSKLAAAQETALKGAQHEALAAVVERESALKALHDAVSDYEIKLAARDVAVLDAEERIRDLAMKLEASKRQILVEQAECESRLMQMDTTWRLKHDTLEAKVKDSFKDELKSEYTALQTDFNNLKVECDSFRNLMDSMLEEKDKEIAHLLNDYKKLQRISSSEARVGTRESNTLGLEQFDRDSPLVPVADQQILLLARQQALREEEVSQCQRHIQVLQEEITDLEHENRLHCQQEAFLKEEIMKLERSQKRDGVDMTYLKNVILKLLETGEVEALLPVVAMLLQFTPGELNRCHETYNNATPKVPLNGVAAVGDTTVSAPRAIFSRLNFTV